MAEESSIAIGIDLGTTYSCVATVESEQAGPRVLTYDYDRRIFPSTFSIKDGVWRIGKHDITNNPGDVQFIHNVKRILGRNFNDGRLKEDIKKWSLPFELDDDGNPFCRVGDEKVRPVEFVALLLLRAQKIVTDATGKVVTRCVITVPAYFSDAQRRATRDAANIAGMEVLRILNEPTAVAVACLWNSDKNGKFLVVDAGGGTIDCSEVGLSTSHRKKTFVVAATSGNNALGGHDFTLALTDLFRTKVDGIHHDVLMGLCEEAKKQNDDPIQIQISGKTYTIAQAQYKRSLKPLLAKVRTVINEALGKDTVEAVILAGGASCQRHFQELVSEVLPNIEILPRRPAAEVVAEGAAIEANTSNIVVTDALGRSVGIDTQHKKRRRDDIMEVVLKRNLPLPTSYTMDFTAVHDKETEVHVYEGERTKSSENNSLGVFCIGVSAGMEIKVTIQATSDAEIHVQAVTAQGSTGLRVKRKESELTDSELQTMRDKTQQRFASYEVSLSQASRRPMKGKPEKARKKGRPAAGR